MWKFCVREKVGNREDSNIYIKNKLRSATDVGIMAKHFKFDRNVSELELMSEIQRLNNDTSVNGIIVQLPFDSEHNINSDLIINSVNPDKDVDGLHFINAGRLAHGQLEQTFIPCTPKGSLELIKSVVPDLTGKKAVVIGRSKLVGAPMANLLRLSDATVTICHSKTQNLVELCRQAEILVVAIGKRYFSIFKKNYLPNFSQVFFLF